MDLSRIPKAELHLHFEAAMSRASAARLAERHGLPEPAAGPFRDLTEFVEAYELARDIVGSLDDLRDLAEDLAARQRAAGVVWSEIHFIPATYSGRLGPADGLVEAVLDGLRAGAGADHAGLVIGVNRGRPLGEGEAMLDLATRWAGNGVVAFGLAGDEANHPASRFTDLFARAAAHGLPTVPHGGEGAGADHLRETVELLAPRRVCHGVRAPEDPAVVELLRERDVCLDMAPVSNVLLRVVSDLASHPLPVLLRQGVPVTLNTDIPLFTGVPLNEEYQRCAEAWALTDDEVVRLARTSIERSFCPDGVRTAALADLDRRLVEVS
jgi:adenosine deaminase